jgi:hypothetical protein
MKTVRPKPLGTPTAALPLTQEDRFVLSRIDGRLSVRDLVALTGMDEPRVEQIVSKLASHGAVALEGVEASSGYLPDVGSEPSLPGTPASPPAPARARGRAVQLPPPDAGTTSFADFAAALGMDPSAFVAAEAGSAAVEQPIDEERVESRSNYPPPATSEPPEPLADLGRIDELEDVATLPELEEVGEEPEEVEEASDGPVEEELPAETELSYRKLYEARFHALPSDARVGLAKTAHGADLMALCFDADPRVVAAILENATTGLAHIRLIAFHHRTGTGLEMVSRRSEYLRDGLVERRLLRNPQAGDTVLGRIFASKRLFQTYKIAIDRDVPELTRAKGRGQLRKKFQSAPSEERADLVIRTEGRCLPMMTGCAFDAKMTTILCGRQYNSVLFIQNLAKFSATPPALLAHLVKQPFVRKIQPLKKLLLQHPNMPGDAKRQM